VRGAAGCGGSGPGFDGWGHGSGHASPSGASATGRGQPGWSWPGTGAGAAVASGPGTVARRTLRRPGPHAQGFHSPVADGGAAPARPAAGRSLAGPGSHQAACGARPTPGALATPSVWPEDANRHGPRVGHELSAYPPTGPPVVPPTTATPPAWTARPTAPPAHPSPARSWDRWTTRAWTRVGAFDDPTVVTHALHTAGQTAVAIADMHDLDTARTQIAHLQTALESRAEPSRPRACGWPSTATAPTRPSRRCPPSPSRPTPSCATSPSRSSPRYGAPVPRRDRTPTRPGPRRPRGPVARVPH
jgi:hypothetical protein